MNTKEEKRSIRFAIFADLHYKKGLYASTVQDLETVLARANECGAEFVVHAGDFSNDYISSPEIFEEYLNNKYHLPVYGVYGNHELEKSGTDMSIVSQKLTNRAVVWGTDDGKPGDGSIGYFYTDIRDFRLICLDSNYSFNPDTNRWEHNHSASFGAPAENLYEDSVDSRQLSWLEGVLTDAAKNEKGCIVISHAGFSGMWPSSPSANEVRTIFKRVNEKRSGTVLLSASGHYHTNRAGINDGVLYFDVNTVRNILWVPNSEAYPHYDGVTRRVMEYDECGRALAYRDTDISTLRMAKNTWFSEEPLSAIVTVSKNGRIEIEGAESSYLDGIIPNFDLGEEVSPKILSATFKIGDTL